MEGLSQDIKLALDTVIEGLEYKFSELDMLNPEKMQIIMKSKVSSFASAKEILIKWAGSPNSPSKDTLSYYIGNVIEAGDKALLTLRHALRKKIDYSELDAERHNQAIVAKSFIINAVFDLDKSLVELRQKKEDNDFDLADKEFKIGYPERFAKGSFFNIKNYWKDWYNEETDGVNICPFSTKGETIVLQDLHITLPEVPKDKTTILFHDLPQHEQYWRRQDEPENITPDNVELWDEYITEEYRRRREGVWFYNHGKPTYLTGNHYWALQWCKMLDNGAYMDFRYAQLNMFYHLEACIVDPRCLGQLFVKSRRTGFTYTVLAILLNMATSTKNGKYGMTSKSGDDVQEAFDKFSYMFLSLPFFFRPVVKGKEDSPTELFFGKPSNNSKEAKKTRDTGVKDYLNTSIDHRPTKNDSYDSVKLNGYLGDECVSPNTKVLTPSGLKLAKDINIGDFVLNSNGEPTEIVALTRGRSDMYKVSQPYGKDYEVTGGHKLYLWHSKKKENVFISVEEYMALSKNQKRQLTRVTNNQFSYSKKDLPLDAYLLGLWIGDGSSKDAKFVLEPNKDFEIHDYLKDYAHKNDLELIKGASSDNWLKVRLSDSQAKNANQATGSLHRIIKPLKDLGIFGKKRIPEVYLTSSVEDRLNLLAGIIDTDGYKTRENGFVISMSRLDLIEDIYRLSKELGLDTSEISTTETNFGSLSYAVRISDYNGIVPCRVERKKPTVTKEVNRRGKMEIEYIGAGDYVGFTMDGKTDEEQLFVLEDYTVTKNCFKWTKPHDYIVHMGMITPTMMPAGRVVGKAFIGSTMGARSKGGEQGVEMINGSRVADRNAITKKTSTGLYMYFLAAQENMEEFTDKYGKCWTEKPPTKTYNVLGELIETGSVEYLLAVEEQKKKQSDKALNEQLRTYPRTLEHALRDESTECVFNINKLYEQIDYNDRVPEESRYAVGNFRWKGNIVDGDVEFYPDNKGRFKISWMPSKIDSTEHLRNRVKEVNGKFYPLNLECVRFGCDPFSLKSTHGKGSKGGLHGKTIFTPEGGAPSNKFVVEYLARPADETVFFEDVIKCIRFYGAPILVESNRIDLLRHMRNRGYRGFAMNRLDRPKSKLNPNELEYGGQTMSGPDIIDSHLNAIGLWIEQYVGIYADEEKKVRKLGEIGDMPFQETLKDWLSFNPDKRTEYDATISSGLAIMACYENRYQPKRETPKRSHVKTLIKQYNNKGSISTAINK